MRHRLQHGHGTSFESMFASDGHGKVEQDPLGENPTAGRVLAATQRLQSVQGETFKHDGATQPGAE